MADNNQTSSPIDLGKLIIDGNHAMLNPGASQGNNGGESQGLLQKNSVTGLTDDQANALASVIKASNKTHAEEAYNTLGHDGAATLVALHNIASQGQSNTGDVQPVQPQPQQNTIVQQPVINQPQYSQNQLTSLQQQAMNIIQPQGVHPLGMALNLLGNITGMRAANQAINSAQLNNIGKVQKITGQEPLQQSEIQTNQLPMTAYQRAETGVQRATMLLNYGGKVSEDFQKTIQPHIDTVNSALNANNLYQNVLASPNNQQAQQSFLEASAQLQGVKDPKALVQGRGAPSATKGALNQFFGGGGYSQKELSRIQAANIAKYNVSQKAMDSMTQQHKQRLQKLGLDPDQFVNQYGQQSNGQYSEGQTATNPQTGQKITFRGGKWQ